MSLCYINFLVSQDVNQRCNKGTWTSNFNRFGYAVNRVTMKDDVKKRVESLYSVALKEMSFLVTDNVNDVAQFNDVFNGIKGFKNNKVLVLWVNDQAEKPTAQPDQLPVITWQQFCEANAGKKEAAIWKDLQPLMQ